MACQIPGERRQGPIVLAKAKVTGAQGGPRQVKDDSWRALFQTQEHDVDVSVTLRTRMTKPYGPDGVLLQRERLERIMGRKGRGSGFDRPGDG